MSINSTPFESVVYTFRHPLVKAGGLVMLLNILALIVIFLMWWPEHQKIVEIKDKIQERQHQIEALRNAHDLIDRYRGNIKALKLFEEKLSNETSQSELVAMLNNISRKNNIKIISESHDEQHDDSKQIVMTTDLQLQGKYTGIKSFLVDLDNAPIWSEIVEVRLESGKSKSTINGRLRLTTYAIAAGVSNKL